MATKRCANGRRRFEIADLGIEESDPQYADAVRCVQTYWKQAARIDFSECLAYQGYLGFGPKGDCLEKPAGGVTSHPLYRLSCGADGLSIQKTPSWTAYMFLSALYGDLPKAYLKAVELRYGSSDIKDHTDSYRRLYPEPLTSTKKSGGKLIWTARLPKNALQKETISKINIASDPQQDAIPIQKNGIDVSTSESQQNIIFIEAQKTPLLPTPAQPPLALDQWNIDKVVDTMTAAKRKNLSSASETSSKRARHDKELLEQVTQHNENTQQSIRKLESTIEHQGNKLRSAMEDQGDKLQGVCEVAEQNTQTIGNMQNELRQFMSAVASTLRDIQERLDD